MFNFSTTKILSSSYLDIVYDYKYLKEENSKSTRNEVVYLLLSLGARSLVNDPMAYVMVKYKKTFKWVYQVQMGYVRTFKAK